MKSILKKRSILLMLLFFALSGGFSLNIWVYRTISELQKLGKEISFSRLWAGLNLASFLINVLDLVLVVVDAFDTHFVSANVEKWVGYFSVITLGILAFKLRQIVCFQLGEPSKNIFVGKFRTLILNMFYIQHILNAHHKELNPSFGNSGPNGGTPLAEVHIDTETILQLLSDQHPDLAGLPIQLLDSGWDNMMFRLGTEFCVRIPRRQLAAELIRHEQKWLPELARSLPLPVPAPIRVGSPTSYYPWHWSVVPWIEGRSADEAPLLPSQARILGAFLKALHREAPSDLPQNPHRGISLSEKNHRTRERIERISSHLGGNAQTLSEKWDTAVTAVNETSRRVLHGDLHPQNVLSREGEIVGVIDWGDLTGGDVATDLASAWMFFHEPSSREDFFTAYGEVSPNTITRAEGWAISFGTMLLDTGLVNNPRHEALGRKILENILG